jgi:diguanylate cyclase (GGDEF)-like protein
MDSLFQQINQSAHADAWRRFRISAEQLVELTQLVRALGYTVTEIAARRGGALITQMADPVGVLCVAEPSFRSPSPFSLGAEPYAVGYTDCADAIRECAQWFGTMSDIGGGSASMLPGVSPLAMLLEREERTAWLDLERQILQALQPLNQLDLEAEPLFLNFSHAIRDVLAPDLLELRLETPADFWPGRGPEWSWVQTRGAEDVSLSLTPRLLRLLYRRERVLFVEDLATAPDIQLEPLAESRAFQSAFLLPFSSGAKPLGTLRLLYRRRLAPLPGDVEAVELFRRELAAILDRSRSHLRMQRMATVDGLTNLFNHRFFRDQLRTEFQRALRYQKMMAVIMIDIDDFKVYNDTYGHLAGDRVLAETARAIRGSVRDIDFVARYGGEEFALILPEVDAASGLIVAEKIRRAVEAQRFISDDGEAIGAITVSCGVTDNVDTTGPDDLIERADRALYWVKRHGRNLVRLAADVDE